MRGGVHRRVRKAWDATKDFFLLPRDIYRNIRHERAQKKIAKMQEDLDNRGWTTEEYKANTKKANKLLGNK